jgi:hypothetical protein
MEATQSPTSSSPCPLLAILPFVLFASYITHLKKRKHLVVWLLENING